MTPDLSGIVGIVSIIITGFFAWLTAKTKAKADKDVATAPDWQTFTDKIQSWTETQLSDRDEKIDKLESELEVVKSAIKNIEAKYARAISHIRDWRSMFPNQGPEIPLDIADDVT